MTSRTYKDENTLFAGQIFDTGNLKNTEFVTFYFVRLRGRCTQNLYDKV